LKNYVGLKKRTGSVSAEDICEDVVYFGVRVDGVFFAFFNQMHV